MNRLQFLARGTLALFLMGSPLLAAPGTIEVTFTNRSGYDVTFFLNGGEGLETSLKDRKLATYTMTVDQGVEPEIKIHQVKGEDEVFSLNNKGRYVFRVEGGKIINGEE